MIKGYNTARVDHNSPTLELPHISVQVWMIQVTTQLAAYQQAVETSRKLSGQLRAAEGRIRELEVEIRRHQDRADRAEKWLYQISVEIAEIPWQR